MNNFKGLMSKWSSHNECNNKKFCGHVALTRPCCRVPSSAHATVVLIELLLGAPAQLLRSRHHPAAEATAWSPLGLSPNKLVHFLLTIFPSEITEFSPPPFPLRSGGKWLHVHTLKVKICMLYDICDAHCTSGILLIYVFRGEIMMYAKKKEYHRIIFHVQYSK